MKAPDTTNGSAGRRPRLPAKSLPAVTRGRVTADVDLWNGGQTMAPSCSPLLSQGGSYARQVRTPDTTGNNRSFALGLL